MYVFIYLFTFQHKTQNTVQCVKVMVHICLSVQTEEPVDMLGLAPNDLQSGLKPSKITHNCQPSQ